MVNTEEKGKVIFSFFFCLAETPSPIVAEKLADASSETPSPVSSKTPTDDGAEDDRRADSEEATIKIVF